MSEYIRNQRPIKLPMGWYVADPASIEEIDELKRFVAAPLPLSYLHFLSLSNGGEGMVGSRYVSLWSAREVLVLNKDYGVARYMPAAVAFATDGGDLGYVFDYRSSSGDPPILEVGLGDLGYADAHRVARDFSDFMEQQN